MACDCLPYCRVERKKERRKKEMKTYITIAHYMLIYLKTQQVLVFNYSIDSLLCFDFSGKQLKQKHIRFYSYLCHLRCRLEKSRKTKQNRRIQESIEIRTHSNRQQNRIDSSSKK